MSYNENPEASQKRSLWWIKVLRVFYADICLFLNSNDKSSLISTNLAVVMSKEASVSLLYQMSNVTKCFNEYN